MVRVVFFTILLICLATANGDPVNASKMQKPGPDCSFDNLRALAAKIRSLQLEDISEVMILTATDPNNDQQKPDSNDCKWVISIPFYKEEYNPNTPLKQILSDMNHLKDTVEANLLAAGVKKSMLKFIEYLQSEKPLLEEAEPEVEALALLEAQSQRSTAHHLRLIRRQGQSSTSTQGAPTKLAGGQPTTLCEKGTWGTIGGLIDIEGTLHAMTSAHVYDIHAKFSKTPMCKGQTLVGYTANIGSGLTNSRALDQRLRFTTNPVEPTCYVTAGDDKAFDLSTVPVESGTPVDCGKVNGRHVKGVRATSTFDQFGADSEKPFRVFKVGGVSGLTKGMVFGFEDYYYNTWFGYKIIATSPDLPPHPSLRDPRSPRVQCSTCWRPNGNDHQIKSRAQALKASGKRGVGEAWDPRIFAYFGDSGSWVYDESMNVVCIIKRGRWVYRFGKRVAIETCIPFAAAIAKIESLRGLKPGTIKVCTPRSLKHGKAP